MPIIRPLAPSDLAAAAALWHQGWHDAHAALLAPEIVAMRTRDSFERRAAGLADDSFVAVDGDDILAFGALHDDEIDQFYVARSSRGTGLAKQFMSVLEERLRARGVVDAKLQCAEGNARAHAFYRRAGWQDGGIRDLPIWMPDARCLTYPTHLFEKRLG